MDQQSLMLLTGILLVAAGVLFRRWYLSKPRLYEVAETSAGKLLLKVTERNPRFETASIELKISGKDVTDALLAGIEFIDKKGGFERKSLAELEIDDIQMVYEAENKYLTIEFEKRDLMRGIRQLNIQLHRFRFVINLHDKPLIKSPVFAFSSKYMLFRPDSGRYN